MKLVIEIGLDNAAFQGDGLVPEVQLILHALERRLVKSRGVPRKGEMLRLHDTNGNTVGCVRTEGGV